MPRTPLPDWPSMPPTHGRVLLRAVQECDVEMARELSTDPYVPLTGTLPPHAGVEDALAWVSRQRGRHEERAGFSFTVTDTASGAAVGHCGLWLRDLDEGRATAGYAIAPSSRGRGYAADALVALTRFAWSLPGPSRVTLRIEPWNVASTRTAERAGYVREGVLRRRERIGDQLRDVLVYAAGREGWAPLSPASPAPRGTPRSDGPRRAG